jgi:hypothetical protein
MLLPAPISPGAGRGRRSPKIGTAGGHVAEVNGVALRGSAVTRVDPADFSVPTEGLIVLRE